MPRTGTPSCSTLGSHTGASLSYTELGPPDKTIPTGSSARISSSFAVHGKTAENTCCSRIRRAINCVYCPPKSSTTIPCRVLTVPPACCCAAVPVLAVISVLEFLLSQNYIYKLPGHDNCFGDFLAGNQYRNPRVSHRAIQSFLFTQIVFHQNLPAQAPIDLNDHLELFFTRQIVAILRPLFARQAGRMPQHLPQLFRDMRRHGRKHQQQHFQPALQDHWTQVHVQGLLRVNLVHQRHQQRNRSVEVPTHLEIIGDALQRLMHLAYQQLFLCGRVRQIRLLRQIRLHAAQPFGVVRHQPVNLLQKTRRTFDRLLAPFQIFFRRRRKKRVQTPRIAAVFIRHVNRAHHVAAIDMADKYGCDTGRLYTLFAAPPEKDLEWSEEAIEGSARFLKKVYRLVTDHSERLRGVQTDLTQQTDLANATAKEKLLVRKVHQTLKRITNDFEVRWHFNTSVSLLMTLVNEIHAQEPLDVDLSPMILKRGLEMLLLMLSPMAPHIAEELWQMLGHETSLAREKWPQYRDDLAREEQFEVIIQINGRLRGKILVEDDLSEEETLNRGLTDPRIAVLIAGKEITKTIVVPRKLVNIVLR